MIDGNLDWTEVDNDGNVWKQLVAFGCWVMVKDMTTYHVPMLADGTIEMIDGNLDWTEVTDAAAGFNEAVAAVMSA